MKGKVDRFPNLYIGGDWVTPSSGRMIESINPATGQVWAETAETDEKDIDKAVQAARDAFEGEWSRRTPSERGLALRPLRRPGQRERRQDRQPRHKGQRQAHPRVHGRGRQRRPLEQLLRGPRRQDRRHVPADLRAQRVRLHDSPAVGSSGRHRRFVRYEDVELDEGSIALELRRLQDATFAPATKT